MSRCTSTYQPPERFTGVLATVQCRLRGQHGGYHTAEYGHTTYEWDDEHAILTGHAWEEDT